MEDLKQVPIIDSIPEDSIQNFTPVYLRYFEEKVIPIEEKGKKLDIMHRVHSNKIVLVYIAKGNSIITSNKKIKNIDFTIGNEDRRNLKLTGKHKKGAQQLKNKSIICIVETEDGEKYPVYAGMTGKLIEINNLIFENPNLIVDDCEKGFIAIILPKLKK